MQQRTRKTLQGQGGFAMILVLCLGALFLALSAAMIYAAGVLTANANRQLQEQELYERAASFSKVLEEELLSGSGGSFADFVGKEYVTSSYGCNSEHAFVDNEDGLTITLEKRASEDNENVKVTDRGVATYTPKQVEYSAVQDLMAKLNSPSIDDYVIDVSVTVSENNETYTYTQSYRHYGTYEVTYTIGDDDTRYTYDEAAGGFKYYDSEPVSVRDVVDNDRPVTMHCNMTNKPSDYSFELY